MSPFGFCFTTFIIHQCFTLAENSDSGIRTHTFCLKGKRTSTMRYRNRQMYLGSWLETIHLTMNVRKNRKWVADTPVTNVSAIDLVGVEPTIQLPKFS